jgi:dCTP deaminase
VPDSLVQPASVDLRLGPVAYRLRSSFLPGSRSVESCLKDWQLGPAIPLTGGGAVLERARPYLIPLMEELRLPGGVRARTNPKSSTGRVDVFTRVIVEGATGFDQVPAGYHGPVYLEVVSRSFAVQVRRGLSLNQVRLVYGDQRPTDADLRRLHAKRGLLYTRAEAAGPQRLPDLQPSAGGLFVTVDLLGDAERVVGYRAKKNSGLLDLTAIGGHRVDDFWDVVRSDRFSRLILEPEEFYLLVSAEGIAIPPDYAAEMTAYDPTSGELRTHYAGFFDPGFGHAAEGSGGSRAVLEVRAHDVPFALDHGQKIARLEFEPMVLEPERLYGPDIGSSYQGQGLKLSKHFQGA